MKLLTALHFFVLQSTPHRAAVAAGQQQQQGQEEEAQEAEAEEEEEDGWVDWQAHPQWSDRSIMAVLAVLPPAAELEGRAAGERRFADAETEPRWKRRSAEDVPDAWCSHCDTRQTHSMVEANLRLGRRSIYRCRGCGGRTLPCRGGGGSGGGGGGSGSCGAMTRGGVWDNDKCSVCGGDRPAWPS